MTRSPEDELEVARNRWRDSGWRDLAAYDAVLDAERALAHSRGEEYATVVDIGVRWNTGAPHPHVVSNGSRTFIVCYVGERDPNWDGTHVRMVSASDESDDIFGIIDIWGCASMRIGAPNDEAIQGHQLYWRGLGGYEAHEVTNSRWLEHHIRQNSVHRHHSDATWRSLHHYVLTFHDEMVEALGRGIEARLERGNLQQLLLDCARALVANPHRR